MPTVPESMLPKQENGLLQQAAKQKPANLLMAAAEMQALGKLEPNPNYSMPKSPGMSRTKRGKAPKIVK